MRHRVRGVRSEAQRRRIGIWVDEISGLVCGDLGVLFVAVSRDTVLDPVDAASGESIVTYLPAREVQPSG